MSDSSRRTSPPIRCGWAWLAIGVALIAAISFPTWQHFYPVQTESGWSYTIFRDGIPKVSALARDGTGNLYVSQGFLGQQGRILKLGPGSAADREILAKLDKPSGMVPFRGGIVVSQEARQRPVLWWREGKEAEPLFAGNSVEGVATDGHCLIAIEDTKDARLMKYDPATKLVTTMRGQLEEAEGVAVCPDGRVYYSEKKKGWVKKLQPEGDDEIVAKGLNRPGFLLCDREGVWISEDATHLGRLLLLDGGGTMHTILSHTRSGQAILALGPGRYLFAEQGRQRILELSRAGH